MAAMIEQQQHEAIERRIRSIPISATLNMQVIEEQEGFIAVRIPRRYQFDGIFHSLHGGILMTLADSAAAYAILTLTGADEPMTTTDMNIRFLAPCLSGATARARVVKLGRTMCPVQVEVVDDDGKLVAIASVNYMRLPPQERGSRT